MAREYLAAFVSHDNTGVEFVNTLAIKNDAGTIGPPEVADADILGHFRTWLKDHYLAVLNPAYTLNRLTLTGILGHVASYELNVGEPGTLPTPGSPVPLPKECTLVVTLRSGIPGRSHRGRMYLPSPLYSNLTDTTFWNQTSGSAYWVNAGTLFDAVLAGHDYSSGGFDYHMSARIFSRKLALTSDVTGYLRRAAVHWLRSRSTAP